MCRGNLPRVLAHLEVSCKHLTMCYEGGVWDIPLYLGLHHAKLIYCELCCQRFVQDCIPK